MKEFITNVFNLLPQVSVSFPDNVASETFVDVTTLQSTLQWLLSLATLVASYFPNGPTAAIVVVLQTIVNHPELMNILAALLNAVHANPGNHVAAKTQFKEFLAKL